MSIYKSVRRYCLTCMGWDGTGPKPVKFVRECFKLECDLHPFRMGKNPFHPMSRLKRSLDNLRRGKNTPGGPPVFEPTTND